MYSKSILPRVYSDAAMKAQYARVAWFYDGWGRFTEDKALRKLLQHAHVNDGSSVLEVAVGTGRLFEQLVKRNPAGVNQGMELSPAMLAHARRRLQHDGVSANYQLQVGSAYALSYEAASFDLLFNTYMLDMFPVEDYPRVLGEFLRVLKPGGKLALAYFAHGRRWTNSIWPWLAKHQPALLAGCRPVELRPYLEQLGLEILHHEYISQNTFPSEIVIAKKAG